MNKYLITTIAAKKKSEFVDPFSPEGEEEEKSQEAPVVEAAPVSKKPDPKAKGGKDASMMDVS